SRVERFGSFFYFGFPPEERHASLFYFFLRDKGVHIREGFPCFMTTAHSDTDIALIVQAFKDSAIEMQSGGFFSDLSATSLELFVVAPPMATDLLEPIAEVPLTEAQREIFLAAKLGDDASCSFNESFRVDLRGALQIEALRESVNSLLARHEI